MAEQLQIAHKKALKQLEKEKLKALKLIKDRAKKSDKKQLLKECEDEFAAKERDLKEKQEQELLALKVDDVTLKVVEEEDKEGKKNKASAGTDTQHHHSSSGSDDEKAPPTTTVVTNESISNHNNNEINNDNNNNSNVAMMIGKKKSKAQKKREKAKAAAKAKEAEIQKALQNAGPSARDVEVNQLKQRFLDPLNLDLIEVAADGHCLYRSVADQLNYISGRGDNNNNNNITYEDVRSLAADTLLAGEEQYSPFIDIDPNNPATTTFSLYCETVRTSAEWGGQVELQALSDALKKPIEIYSLLHGKVVLGEEYYNNNTNNNNNNTTTSSSGSLDHCHDNDHGQVLKVSFHSHYYALGEHYNSLRRRNNNYL